MLISLKTTQKSQSSLHKNICHDLRNKISNSQAYKTKAKAYEMIESAYTK